MSLSILIAPHRFVCGRGAIKEIGDQVSRFGDNALILGGTRSIASVKDEMLKSLEENKVKAKVQDGVNKCTWKLIDEMVKAVQDAGCNIIIAVGGGTALDAGKAIAYKASIPVVNVPTITATDAPCSALSVIYTEEGVFQEYLFLPKSPEAVIVDFEVAVKAPERWLISGMGDALATWWEADACAKSGAQSCAGGTPLFVAIALARLCYDTLMRYGRAAARDISKHVVTPAIEHVMVANVLLSGLGFESGGLAGAHGIHNALTVLKETHKYTHGEKVAFGTLAQLILENRTNEEIDEVYKFSRDVGLPVTLGEIGVQQVTREYLLPVAETAAADTVANEWVPTPPEVICDAMIAADTLGHEYLSKES